MSDISEEKTYEKTIEENFDILDGMVRRLESEEVPLEESFKIYEEGMKLLKELNGRIDQVEKKMQVISADGTLEDFT